MTDKAKVGYDLPRFDDWQADSEWRLRLEVNAYVDTVPVGRDVFLTGRVSWRTMPGRPDSEGWHNGGSYLYRVTPEGGILEASGLDPTDKMVRTVRDAIEPDLEPPSDGLRLREVRETIKRRKQTALDKYNQDLKDLATWAERFAAGLVVDVSELLTDD